MRNYPEILSGVCELLEPFAGQSGHNIGEDTDLIGELELSSLKIMDLLMEVEDHFDVTIPLNRLPEVRTVGDLAAMIDQLVDRPS